jgi:hypothetical protein
MLPAHQRLEPEHRTGTGGHDRLVVHHELVVVDGPAQVAVGPQAPFDGDPQRVVEDLHPAPAALLGPVHRHVGVAQQAVGGGGAGTVGERDTDAGPHGHLAVPAGQLDRDGRAERGDEPLGDR